MHLNLGDFGTKPGLERLDVSELIRANFDQGLRPLDKPGPKLLRDVIPSGKGRLSTEEYLRRIHRGQTSGMHSMLTLMNTERSNKKPSVCCIVGGGPTLEDRAGALWRMAKSGAKTLAVNKSHDWLLRRGLPCHYAALLDPKEWVAGYINLDLLTDKQIRRRYDKALWANPKYLIASQVHDDTLNKFLGRDDAYLWHAAAGLGELEILKTQYADQLWASVAGASVIGLRAVGVAHGLGFREIHLFGIDGSGIAPKNPGDKPQLYAYDKPHIDETWKTFEVKLNSGWARPFVSNHHMARAVYEFEDSMKEWDLAIKEGRMAPFIIRVHGNPEVSAIAMVAAGMGVHADPTQNEKYGKPPESIAA